MAVCLFREKTHNYRNNKVACVGNSITYGPALQTVMQTLSCTITEATGGKSILWVILESQAPRYSTWTSSLYSAKGISKSS